MASFRVEWKPSTKKDLRRIFPDQVARIVNAAGGLSIERIQLGPRFRFESDTEMGSAERHAQIAQQCGWPPPSRGIVYLGMVLAPFGAGLVGFAIGRRQTEPLLQPEGRS